MIVVVVAFCAAAHAQERPANRFEVATVKPHHPESKKGFGTEVYPGGRIFLSSRSLKSLVSTAFGHANGQIANIGASWIDNDEYDVEAKAPADAGITNFNHTLFDIDDRRLREMLQTLLIDRFQLRVRRETRTGDIYQLTRTSRPFRMQPAAIPEGRTPSSMYTNIGYVGGRWSMQFMTMEKLAEFASRTVVRAPVADLTNLSGPYDYRQATHDQEPAYSGIEQTGSFLRMLNDVGLEMKRTRGPVEWLVIEGAARPSPD